MYNVARCRIFGLPCSEPHHSHSHSQVWGLGHGHNFWGDHHSIHYSDGDVLGRQFARGAGCQVGSRHWAHGCSCLSPGLRTWGLARGGGRGHEGEEVEAETLDERVC